MNPEEQRQIASKGGRAAHVSGHAHEFTSEEARIAGRKGGLASHRRDRLPEQEQTEHEDERLDDDIQASSVST